MRKFDLGLRNFWDNFKGKTKYGAMATMAAPVVIIASAYMAYRYSKRGYIDKQDAMISTRSMSVGALHGGKLALQILRDFNHVRADMASLNAAETELKALLAEEPIDFNKLQSTVSKLEMSGKELVAVEILERNLEIARKEKKSHEAYEIEMLLVEMLIYKGDWEKALNCDCLSHEEISDARRPLYKAIIHLMLDHPKEEAIKCWEEFTEVRTRFQSPMYPEEDPQSDKTITHFHQFNNVVNELRKDIDKARNRTSLARKKD